MDPRLNNLMLLQQMFNIYGEKEVVGDAHNPDVVKLFADAGFAGVKDDETSWCAATILACANRAGYDVKNGMLTARSLLKCGEAVDEPVMGDVVVLWRDSKLGWKGHVGLFVRKDSEKLYLLGGNQGNSVTIAAYDANRLLGYRRLKPLIEP